MGPLFPIGAAHAARKKRNRGAGGLTGRLSGEKRGGPAGRGPAGAKVKERRPEGPVKATDRISQVLAQFTPTTPERTTGDIARACGIANSTAHDLLNGLADAGLLSRQAPGRFRLGPGIARLAETLLGSDTLIEAARPVVVRTAENYGETCHVLVMTDGRLISMTAAEGHSAVRVARGAINQDAPLHATAPGKLLLAALPLAELNRVLAGMSLTAVTPRTVTQKSILRDQIAGIREDGYAAETGELDPHMASAAAPVRNHSGMIIAAFALLVPASRFAEQARAYRNICLEAARATSVRMGWAAPAGESSSTEARP